MRAEWAEAGASGSQRFPQHSPPPRFNICSLCSHTPQECVAWTPQLIKALPASPVLEFDYHIAVSEPAL